MKNNEKNVATNTTLADCLVYNNRFATTKLDADQLGAEGLKQWTTLVNNLHRSAYKVYAQCENSGLKAEDTTVDKTEIFDAIRVILGVIGEVNEHKMYANEECAIAMIGYAGKRGNLDAPELQYCISRIRNKQKEIADYEKLNVLDEDYKAKTLAEMNATLDTLEEEKATLIATADMRIKKPTMTTASAFRLDVEHFFARSIAGQMAKTLEELDQEEAQRKAERQAKAKARKAQKKAEEKKADTTVKAEEQKVA